MTPTELDGEELVHLALRASADQHHEDAMRYLKTATDRFPDNAKAHYLLGAEHASIGMYERAIEDMAEALRLDPRLVTARFQLGLLYMTRGAAVDAERVWQPLDELEPTAPLYLFKTGLTHLIHDRLRECLQALEEGIACNPIEPLNDDMRRVVDDVRARLQLQAPAAVTKSDLSAPSEYGLLSAYRQDRDDSTGGPS
jgi:tetratricopeptide (TPR) repeat protein